MSAMHAMALPEDDPDRQAAAICRFHGRTVGIRAVRGPAPVSETAPAAVAADVIAPAGQAITRPVTADRPVRSQTSASGTNSRPDRLPPSSRKPTSRKPSSRKPGRTWPRARQPGHRDGRPAPADQARTRGHRRRGRAPGGDGIADRRQRGTGDEPLGAAPRGRAEPLADRRPARPDPVVRSGKRRSRRGHPPGHPADRRAQRPDRRRSPGRPAPLGTPRLRFATANARPGRHRRDTPARRARDTPARRPERRGSRRFQIQRSCRLASGCPRGLP